MNLTSASRTDPTFKPPKPSRLISERNADGLRYERRVWRALSVLAREQNLLLDYQPWFSYTTEDGPATCAPDFILRDSISSWALILDAKRSFNDLALRKLEDFYAPIVRKGLEVETIRVIAICRTLYPGAPKPLSTLSGPEPSGVYHWQARKDEPLIWS